MKYSDLESLINYCRNRQCEFCEFYGMEEKSHCYFLTESPSNWDLKKIRLRVRKNRL